MGLNLDYLLEVIWEYLGLLVIYTKKPGCKPDLEPESGIIMRKGSRVEHVCHSVHRDLVDQCKYALVWGSSVKFSPQRVGLQHQMNHEDVIQIVTK